MLSLHATEEALEQYSLGFLEGEDLELIEEHLLICEDCRTALSVADYRILLLRQTLPKSEFSQLEDVIRLKRANVLIFKKASSS